MNLFWCKPNVKSFGFNKLHRDFDIMRIDYTAMDACRNYRSKEKVYTEKKYKHAFSVLNLKALSPCFASGMMFENVGVLDIRKVLLFLEKYAEIGKFL